jgi:hypothetical protein
MARNTLEKAGCYLVELYILFDLIVQDLWNTIGVGCLRRVLVDTKYKLPDETENFVVPGI